MKTCALHTSQQSLWVRAESLFFLPQTMEKETLMLGGMRVENRNQDNYLFNLHEDPGWYGSV